MATYTIRNTSVQDWRDTMMSKAQFNALAAERRANRAGSGFDSFGGIGSLTYYNNVNEGISVPLPSSNAQPNKFYLDPNGTVPPLTSINGVISKLNSIYSTGWAEILLPPAPTVLPYDATLTQQQIDSGVIKHADASNSGLIVNGKFDTDTSWNKGVGWTISGGVASHVAGSANYEFLENTGLQVTAGKKYIVEYTITSRIQGSVLINAGGVNSTLRSAVGTYVDEITPTVTGYVNIVSTSYAPFTGSIADIAVFPADAISRSDLVFLESWHEDVSEKDFVYPLGNVQYLGTTGDAGTPVAGAFAGASTYSLFGNWQASGALVGKGYVWSSMSDAQKKAFVSNIENNCYLDGDKVIQVRYRMRVVAGMGDSWEIPYAYCAAPLQYNSSLLVKPKGKNTSIVSDLGTSTGGIYAGFLHVFIDGISFINGDYGVVQASSGLDVLFSGAYEGKCYALPIALVHRRNQGAYHPTYNPNGTSGRWMYEGSVLTWFNTTIPPIVSISDCFNFASSSMVQIGKVPSGIYGAFISSVPSCVKRPDGLFYDQVHEADILDLRNSSQKVEDYNRLIDREFNKLVAGTYRGKEGETVLSKMILDTQDYSGQKTIQDMGVGVYNLRIANATNEYFPGDKIYFGRDNVVGYVTAYIRAVVSGGTGVGYLQAVVVNNSTSPSILPSGGTSVLYSDCYLYIGKQSTRTKSNTMTHCDIIGNPTNYPTTWKQSGVNGVPLIVTEDGASMLPTGALTTFKLSRKANATPLQVLKSTDSGTTWTALTVTTHYTFSTITNVLTMVTAPATTDLIMVTYQTHTSMAVPAVNSEVLAVGGVKALSYSALTNNGSELCNSLIGKTTTAVAGTKHTVAVPLSECTLDNNKMFVVSALWYPSHNSIGIAGYQTPAVKVFPYLTRSNGKARLQLVFKEMKYSAVNADWGDDSTFNIVDNVSTTTDWYGSTVLIGQKYVELPYFISAGE